MLLQRDGARVASPLEDATAWTSRDQARAWWSAGGTRWISGAQPVGRADGHAAVAAIRQSCLCALAMSTSTYVVQGFFRQ